MRPQVDYYFYFSFNKFNRFDVQWKCKLFGSSALQHWTLSIQSECEEWYGAKSRTISVSYCSNNFILNFFSIKSRNITDDVANWCRQIMKWSAIPFVFRLTMMTILLIYVETTKYEWFLSFIEPLKLLSQKKMPPIEYDNEHGI